MPLYMFKNLTAQLHAEQADGDELPAEGLVLNRVLDGEEAGAADAYTPSPKFSFDKIRVVYR